MGVRGRATRVVVVTFVLLAMLLILDQRPVDALGNANLHVRGADSLFSGGSMYVEGDWWFPSTTCPNRVRLGIKDSEGTVHFIDRIRTREWTQSDPSGEGGASHDAYFLDSIVRLPFGIAPGAGTVIARQKFQLKFPVFGCLTLASKSGRQPVTVTGPAGGSPPVLTEVGVPTEMRQGTAATIGWIASEPCTMTIRVAYEFERGREIAAATVLSEARPEGRQSATWNVVDDSGNPLPAGDYVAYLQCQDDSGISSAVTVKRFHVGFGE